MGGGDRELFRWPCAQLYLIEGDDRALLQSGVFSLFLAQHPRSPQVVAVEAAVGDVQWPVGKDSVVTCFAGDQSRFTFDLPGLIYVLVLDVHAVGGVEIGRLETFLRLYSTFHFAAGSDMKDLEEAAGKYWTSMAARSVEGDRDGEDKADLQLSLGHRSADSVGPIKGVSRSMMKRIQQARRVSAVAKLFSKALVRGAISAATHVDVAGGGTAADVSLAVASVDAVARVVEAVERKSTSPHELVVQAEKPRIVDITGLPSWTLNGLGLQLLLKAVVAANMASAASSSSPSSSSSSSSSPSHLTSPHSTSTLASTFQPPPPHQELLNDSSITSPVPPHTIL